MLTPKGNIHHSRLPKPGTVGTIFGLSTISPKRKCIVESYPLCDGALWTNPHTGKSTFFSHGIHTVNVRFLDNGERRQLSGIWFRDPLDCD